MRVLHVLAQLPSATGSGIFFTNLIKEMGSLGHEQRGVFACQDGDAFDALGPKEVYPVHFKSAALPFAVPGMSDVMPYENTRYSELTPAMIDAWQAAFGEALAQAEADFQPEVVILHHLWMLTALAVDYFPGAKRIGICHNTDLRQAANNPELARRFCADLVKLDLVLALSDGHHAEIRALTPCREVPIVTVGGGYDEGLFFPSLESRPVKDEVRLLYAGKIDPSKGIFALLAAVNALHDEGQRLSLTVVGRPLGEHGERFRELTADRAYIHLVEPVGQRELGELMRRHDLFVMPSFYEGLGLIAIEALACGLRCVTAEVAGLSELLGEEVLASDAIEVVPFRVKCYGEVPRDEAYTDFIGDLKASLLLQIIRCREGLPFPEAVSCHIQGYAWRSIAAKIEGILQEFQ